MLRTMAFATALIGLVSASALAQQKPLPSSSPTPGTPAYTAAAVEAYNRAQAAYERAHGEGPTSEAANAAYKVFQDRYASAVTAAEAEALHSPEVEAAQKKVDAAQSAVNKAKSGSDEAAYESAERGLEQARKYLQTVKAKIAQQMLRKANGGDDVRTPAFWKSVADKKVLPPLGARPAGTACAPSGGLTGMTESIACQEQHSGSGH